MTDVRQDMQQIRVCFINNFDASSGCFTSPKNFVVCLPGLFIKRVLTTYINDQTTNQTNNQSSNSRRYQSKIQRIYNTSLNRSSPVTVLGRVTGLDSMIVKNWEFQRQTLCSSDRHIKVNKNISLNI